MTKTNTTKPASPTPASPTPASPTIAYRIPNLSRPPADFTRAHRQEPAPPRLHPVPPDRPVAPDPQADRIATAFGRGLQLSRASVLTLTRLQMAIKCGDRRTTMAAIDQLHALDAEMEQFVERLGTPAPDDPTRGEWDAIARHLADQKLSLAFEKLALVSEISGPDMVSPPPDFGPSRAVPEEDADLPDPPLSDWPRLPAVQPAEWTTPPAWLLGLVAAMLAMAAVAAVVVVLTGG